MEKEYLEILSRSIVFKGMSEEEIDIILTHTPYQKKHFNAGEMIAQAGASCDYARIIIEGRVSGEMMDLAGKVLKIEDMETSKLLAPAFLYGKKSRYPVNVTAIAKTTILQINRDDFSVMLQKDVRLLTNFLNAISNRAQFLSEKIRFLSFSTLKAKLAYLILQYSQGREIFKLPFTHQQLAELYGVARPSISREIRIMNTSGLIQSTRDEVRITDARALERLLEQE
ncbi:Crp/Fnr family transcriptional regulator [Bacteroidota bacterium]